MLSLPQLRKQIDRLDNRIVALLNRRLCLVEKVGRVKALNGDKVYDRDREKKLLARLRARQKGPLSDEELQEIYLGIFQASREHQKRVLQKSKR